MTLTKVEIEDAVVEIFRHEVPPFFLDKKSTLGIWFDTHLYPPHTPAEIDEFLALHVKLWG